MFRKLKAELKAAFKTKKSGSPKSGSTEVQPLHEDQHRGSQVFDGGLGRPRGLGGRKSLDATRQASENKDTGDVRSAYSSESGMLQRHVDHTDHCAADSQNHHLNNTAAGSQQQAAPASEQHCQQQHRGLESPFTPRSPTSSGTQLRRRSPDSAAGEAPAPQVDANPTAATAAQRDLGQAADVASAPSHKQISKAASRRHSSHAAAAGASASRCSGPEPSRTPRDEDLGTCPPYATKAVWGLRYSMEDKWAAVPNLVQVPLVLTTQQKKTMSAAAKAAGCGCMLKPSKVLAKVSPGRDKSTSEQAPLVASHHGSDELTSSQELPLLGGTAAMPDFDSLHYFGVFDGHGGADAARHCAQRMHQVLIETIRSMLLPADVAFIAASGDAASSNSDNNVQDTQQEQPSVGPTPTAAAAAPSGSDTMQAAAATASAGNSLTAGGNASSSTSKDWTMATLSGSNGTWLSAALSKSFVNLDREFGVLSEGSYVGSTAVVLLLGSTRLWVAHAGDSRAVLGRRGSAVVLTSDHKASRDDEVARVQAAGGHVWWDRVMGELAVSRAIGDHCLRPYVIPEPEVSVVERTKDDEVLVMASDGLWDVINNQEAAEMALHTLQAAEAAGHIGVAAAKRAATSLTKAALDRGTRDNVTVLVVDLRAKGLTGSQHNSSTNNSSSTNAPTSPAAAGQDQGINSRSTGTLESEKTPDKMRASAIVTKASVGPADGSAAVSPAVKQQPRSQQQQGGSGRRSLDAQLAMRAAAASPVSQVL